MSFRSKIAKIKEASSKNPEEKKADPKKAQWVLLFVTLIWGLTFPLIRISVQTLHPLQFVLIRFTFAFLLFLPFGLKKAYKLSPKQISEFAPKGILLGVVAFLTYQSQTIGLQTVEAGRAAFITGTAVVIVPFLAPVFGFKFPTRIDISAALGALMGLYLLTDPSGSSFARGDVCILMCAFSYACSVLLLQKWATRESDPTVLAFFQLTGVLICSVFLSVFQGWQSQQNWQSYKQGDGQNPILSWPQLSLSVILSISICSIFATVVAIWLQARYQKETTAARAALIFSMEPVFAVVFGSFLLGETLSARGLLGCSVILFSIILSEMIKTKRKAIGSNCNPFI